MALSAITAVTSAILDLNQYRNHLQGAAGNTENWHFRTITNLLVTLADAAGSNEFRINDSADVTVANIDSDGNADFAGTVQAGSSNVTLTTAAGLLRHEAGGIELDINAITTGGLLRGASSGVMNILALGSNNQVLTVTGSTAAWATATFSLAAMLDELRDTRSLIAFVDGPMDGTTISDDSVGLNMIFVEDGSGTFVNVPLRGGAFDIRTGATGDSQAVVRNPGTSATGDRNPHFAAVLTSDAGGAEMKAQGWGFHSNIAVSFFTSTNQHKAFFRQVTTGALFAVTGNAGGEETTSLSGSHTLGNAGVFEVFTTDDGVTWLFEIAGTQVASHSTTVPAVTTLMHTTVGIENNTTTDVRITDIDLIMAIQDRT